MIVKKLEKEKELQMPKNNIKMKKFKMKNQKRKNQMLKIMIITMKYL